MLLQRRWNAVRDYGDTKTVEGPVMVSQGLRAYPVEVRQIDAENWSIGSIVRKNISAPAMDM